MGAGAHHVDHINRRKLDCRRANLRTASSSQNSANRRPWTGSSPFKGVHRFRDKWRAKIQVDGAQRHLGVFDSAEAAARAYDAAAVEAFGEFAWLNFPRAAVPRETGSLSGAFDNLCDRCPTGWRVAGDTLCAPCRAEVDQLYCELPGAEA
jgi:hypothetical protein